MFCYTVTKEIKSTLSFSIRFRTLLKSFRIFLDALFPIIKYSTKTLNVICCYCCCIKVEIGLYSKYIILLKMKNKLTVHFIFFLNNRIFQNLFYSICYC